MLINITKIRLHVCIPRSANQNNIRRSIITLIYQNDFNLKMSQLAFTNQISSCHNNFNLKMSQLAFTNQISSCHNNLKFFGGIECNRIDYNFAKLNLCSTRFIG